MKIFISWSGERSGLIANALKEWIPQIVQAAKPWTSDGIAKGERWSERIGKELSASQFGIVCLVPENTERPWIHFEAGALAKTLDAHVCTFLVGLKSTDVQPPISQFQATLGDQKSDVWKLINSINDALGEKSVRPNVLQTTFDSFWVDFEQKIVSIKNATLGEQAQQKVERTERNLLEEAVTILRRMEREKAREMEREKAAAELGEIVRNFPAPPPSIIPPILHNQGKRLLDGITPEFLKKLQEIAAVDSKGR